LDDRAAAQADRPGRHGGYRTAIDRNLPRGYTISRADLATCMLSLVGDEASVHRHIAIAN